MTAEDRSVELDINGTKRVFDIDDPTLPDWVDDNDITAGGYPYKEKLKRKHYESQLEALQIELVKLQTHLQTTGERIIAVFEGRDSAGKGGSINVLHQFLNPRWARNVALSKPSDVQRGQWYFQRYVEHFPTSGELVSFDRSWYNRGGVEPVMGFCTPEQHRTFLKDAPEFEKIIVEEGFHFFKFWLNIGRETQLKRFHDRRHSPVKHWKLSGIDIIGMRKWDDYTSARDTMLNATHSDHAPWTIIRMNDKRRGRLEVLRHILSHIAFDGRDMDVIGKPDKAIVGDDPKMMRGRD
ncbi:polyphosphate kinase 2 [Oricola sp.]|uniref:polyphosphate kinase 2 n=1 Tax=Oricola sp. TaxID=1979950 RepID=UPI003BAC6440